MITTYDLLSQHPFLAGVAPRHVERLSHWASRAPFHAGTRIFQEHGVAKSFWLIRDGFVNLDIRVPGRGDVTVETIGPGTVLGWSWMFPPYRWHFGAIATEPVLSIALDAEGVRALCEVDTALGYELTKRLAAVVIDRMQASRLRLLDLYQPPV
jgi:CRP-like cAMP-binding protein